MAKWIKYKDPDEITRRYLKCRCGGNRFWVAIEPMAAKRHTTSGHRQRTVAYCGKCSRPVVLKRGA